MRAVAILALALLAAGAAAADEVTVRRGAALFGRPWRAAQRGDALGPLYNERSCAACHDGDAATVVFRTLASSPLGRQLQPRAMPGSTPEPGPDLAWEPVAAAAGLRRPRWNAGGVPLAGRLAPPLRGLGLLARIPGATLSAAADPEDRDRDGVSGQRRGRFGWKAEQPDLAGQISLALSLDLGLATADHPAPAGDCTPAQADCLATAGSGDPVPPGDLAALATYLAALRPRPVPANDAGAALFARAGCATCHTPAYIIAGDPSVTGGTTERIAPFSDLLVHDLGPGLADPSAAADAAEWRTAPLWGLRHRTALLHDGRAPDPRTAVLWHDGEAAASRDRFLSLPAAAQAELLSFLARI